MLSASAILQLIVCVVLARASIVPIDSSSVNVQHSGQDYSYTIKENHGVAIEPLIHNPMPVLKFKEDPSHMEVKDQQIGPLQVKSAQVPGMGYSLPVPTYTYLPGHQYALPYPYGISYPYNLIAAI